MRMRLAAAALAGLCALLVHAAPGQAQTGASSARCGNYYSQVNAAIGRSDRPELQRLLGLAAAEQCAPEAQAARAALARLASPPTPPPPPPPTSVSPPTSPPSPPPATGSPPPPPPPSISAEEAAFNRVQRDNPTCEGWRGYVAVFGSTGTYGRRAAQERDRLCAPPPPPPPASFVDARTTPASTRAPLVRNPAGLPDYALFRECEGCPEMVVIPAGTFQMGSPAGEAGRGEDEDSQAGAGGAPVSVRVQRFAIARFETTWDEWAACVSAGVCQQREDQGYGRGRRPVINVDWQTDTRAFVQFVNARLGAAAPSPRTNGGGGAAAPGYRLPSEAEWEYAARAGTTTAFSWGNSIRPEQAQYWWSASYNGSPTRSTNPSGTALVGSFTANPWGLFDMHGNVWEWVEDCYRDTLSGQTAAAYTTGSCAFRVFRGGGWFYSPQYLRSANRNWDSPSYRFSLLGFRVARTL